MAVKKRSGRKPTGRKADAPLSLRIDAELKQLIERSAGQRGKNLSQEIFRLLRLALGEDQKRSRDQEAQALCYLIGEAADACCLKGDDRINWTTDPWMFEAFRLTINEIIEPIRPHGEALSPANQRA